MSTFTIAISDALTHALLTDIRAKLNQIVNLLALQLKGESTFMADINTELQALKGAVTAETDQDAALAAAIDGAVGTMASGVAEIKALAQQLGTVANDPQMVRDLAAQLKTATETQASKLAALQAASGDLASAVVANTVPVAPPVVLEPPPAPVTSEPPGVGVGTTAGATTDDGDTGPGLDPSGSTASLEDHDHSDG